MLESFREGRHSIAAVLPLLMALGCKPGPVSPDVKSDTGVVIDNLLLEARSSLARCNALSTFSGEATWAPKEPDEEFSPPTLTTCEDVDGDGRADHVHFEGPFGQDWYLTKEGKECTFPVQPGCGPCPYLEE